MDGGSSQKPIVFVFGAEKGDADGRKKNLSAINTQVAYRAHERRRESKSRQRAQAKNDGKVDQHTSVDVSASTPAKPDKNVNVNNVLLARRQQQIPTRVETTSPPNPAAHAKSLTAAEAIHRHSLINHNTRNRIPNDRHESDISSDTSSVQDTTWSASPSSQRHSSPATDMSAVSPLAPVQFNGYFEKGLDPFFRLPTAASDREKWLVHFYFRVMGHIGFGTHQNSLFCPDRDWVSTYVSARSLCFQWVLILAEEHLYRIGVLSNQMQTLARKAKAYNSLTTILRSDSVDRDAKISGIMFAAIVDSAQTNMHLMALDRLIDETGGFDAFLDGPLGVAHPEHIATAYAFGQCPITDVATLNMVKGRFLEALRSFYNDARQEQEQKRRIRNRRPFDTLGRQVIDSNGVLVPANYDEHLRYYTKAQQDSLNSDCLALLLNTSLDTQADYSSQARHLAAMMQTMKIMQDFDHNYLARAMFLRRLKYVTALSTARDPATGQARLSHAGLLLINAFVRQEVQTYIDRTKALLKGVSVSKVVVDCLKVTPLLRPSTRSLLVSWLRDWLCYNDYFEDADFGHLSERDLANISSEITDNWYISIGKAP